MSSAVCIPPFYAGHLGIAAPQNVRTCASQQIYLRPHAELRTPDISWLEPNSSSGHFRLRCCDSLRSGTPFYFLYTYIYRARAYVVDTRFVSPAPSNLRARTRSTSSSLDKKQDEHGMWAESFFACATKERSSALPI